MIKQWQIDQREYEASETKRIGLNRENHRPDCYRDNQCVYYCIDSFEECTSTCEQFTNWNRES